MIPWKGVPYGSPGSTLNPKQYSMLFNNELLPCSNCKGYSQSSKLFRITQKGTFIHNTLSDVAKS